MSFIMRSIESSRMMFCTRLSRERSASVRYPGRNSRMGEYATIEIARRLKKKRPAAEMTDIPGTGYLADEAPEGAVVLPSYEEVCASRRAYAEATRTEYAEHDPVRGRTLAHYTAEWTLHIEDITDFVRQQVERIKMAEARQSLLVPRVDIYRPANAETAAHLGLTPSNELFPTEIVLQTLSQQDTV